MYTITVENEKQEQLELTNNDNYIVTEVDGLYPPDATINTSTLPLFDGSVYNSSRLNERTITITLYINSPAEENRIRLFRYFQVKRKLKLHITNDTRNIWIEGYTSKFSVEYFAQKQIAQITILCPNPHFNTDVQQMYNLSVQDNFVFPFAITDSTPFSISSNIHDITIVNQGDIETGLIIKLSTNAEVKNPRIYNSDTLEFMKLMFDMKAGDEITINTKPKEKSIVLLRDGVQTNIVGYLDLESTWLTALVGATNFIADADSNLESLICTINFSEQYEGV